MLHFIHEIVPLKYVFLLHLAEFLMPFQCYIACVMMCSHGNIVPNEMTPPLLFAKYYTEINAQIVPNEMTPPSYSQNIILK